VATYLKDCRSCAVNKPMTRPTRGLFSPNEVPLHRWEIVTLDFLSGIPTTARGNDFLLIIVDRLTKRMILIPCTKEITGEGTAKLFLEHVFRHHGMARAIISDRDPRFTAAFWRQLHRQLGTKLKMSTANHPQTDGQSERSLRTIMAMLRHYVNEAGADWDEHLWAIEFAYNDSVHEATGFTPFQTDLGRDPATPCTMLARLAQRVATAGKGLPAPIRRDLASAENFADMMRKRLALARAALLRAQEAVARNEALRPEGQVFAAGDYVFLRQDALGGQPVAGKLGPRFLGPLKISERVGLNAYRLMLPKTWGMHPVRNVAELKPAGALRPLNDDAEQLVAGTTILSALEHTEKDGTRQLRFRVAQSGRTGRGAILASTVIKRAGYEVTSTFLRAVKPLQNYLGRDVSKMWWKVDDSTGIGSMQPFKGIVAQFDPTDVDQQYQIQYEDGDDEWLPLSSLTTIMQPTSATMALLCSL
jgi:hypothetical protein